MAVCTPCPFIRSSLSCLNRHYTESEPVCSQIIKLSLCSSQLCTAGYFGCFPKLFFFIETFGHNGTQTFSKYEVNSMTTIGAPSSIMQKNATVHRWWSCCLLRISKMFESSCFLSLTFSKAGHFVYEWKVHFIFEAEMPLLKKITVTARSQPSNSRGTLSK